MLDSRDENGTLSAKADALIADYFADSFRTPDGKRKRSKMLQGDVHRKIGEQLDKFADKSIGRKPAEQLYSNVYQTFSYYVHGRYPESMDLYGGIPGRFHLSGMLNTPKDAENLIILDSEITSASLCFMDIVQRLDLRSIVASDAMLTKWYSSLLGSGAPVTR
jgi:hypothetical protein